MGLKDRKVAKPTETVEDKPNRLYLIEFKDDTGYYIKCGKSSGSSSEDRLMYIIMSYIKLGHFCPYAKILRDVEVTDVFLRETAFHRLFKDRRHYPEHSVSGYTEMFSITKEEALEAFDRVLDVTFNRTSGVRTCIKCGKTLSTIHFYAAKNGKEGLKGECKACTLEYSRSFKQLPRRMYRNQVEHSKSRGHPRPAYTVEEFSSWVLTHSDYEELYNQYVNSGYSKEMVPSVDRIDATKPYTFDNIQLITFKENMRLHGEDNKKSLGTPVMVAIAATGEIVASFISIAEACRCLNISAKYAYTKVDTVVKYGWLATISQYQLIAEDSKNIFTDNGYVKEAYRYKGKASKVVAVDIMEVVQKYEEIIDVKDCDLQVLWPEPADDLDNMLALWEGAGCSE